MRRQGILIRSLLAGSLILLFLVLRDKHVMVWLVMNRSVKSGEIMLLDCGQPH